MQDLDIRGAGNLLGAEQSGFIADLGYETYQKILKEAVTELRTEEFQDLEQADIASDGETEYVADCVIESDMELLIPSDYVPQESERIALYQELDSIERELELQNFRSRLVDRFGKIPPVTAELLRIPRLRRLARRLGIEKVALKQDVMYLYFVDEATRPTIRARCSANCCNICSSTRRGAACATATAATASRSTTCRRSRRPSTCFSRCSSSKASDPSRATGAF